MRIVKKKIGHCVGLIIETPSSACRMNYSITTTTITMYNVQYCKIYLYCIHYCNFNTFFKTYTFYIRYSTIYVNCHLNGIFSIHIAIPHSKLTD